MENPDRFLCSIKISCIRRAGIMNEITIAAARNLSTKKIFP
jgi:hypothetical protein